MFRKYTELSNWHNGLWGENYFVYQVDETADAMDICLKAKPHAACCPECGQQTTKLACGYGRKLTDIPLKGLLPTHLHVQTYKYMCENPECAVRTFADPLPFASLNEYRTDRLNQLILGMSVFMSNEGTSRTLGLMGIQVSADSIDRLWKKVRLVDLPDVETIGIDDIALLKGRTYATAVYAENHQLIAILQGRTADDVMDWLRAHPKIRKVARDRASAYASALSEVLPDAVQVADRFHLLQNLLHHLEMVLKDELPKDFWVGANGLMEKDDVKWKRVQESTEVPVDVSTLHYDNTPPVDSTGCEIQYDAQNHLTGSKAAQEREEKRRLKQERVRSVRKMYAEGAGKTEIARAMELSAGTVSRYLKMTEEEVAGLAFPRPRPAASRAGRYRNIVFKMMQDGLDDRTIFWYLRASGIDDPAASICTTIWTISTNNFPGRTRMHTSRITGTSTKLVPVNAERVSRRKIGVLLCTLKDRDTSNPVLEKCLQEVRDNYPIAIWAEQALTAFHAAVMGSDPAAITSFISEYRNSPLQSFCNGLQMDIEAVQNAVQQDLNSGFVEGGNNKVKVLKRIGYGRASLRTLEAKCVLAFQSTKIPKCDLSKMLVHPVRRRRKAA